MRFHGMAVLYYFAVNGIFLRNEKQFPPSTISIPTKLIKMPVPIQDFHLPSPLLAGSMQGGMASPLHSPKQGTLSSPCPFSGVLFRLPSPGRSIIMAPLRASCHGKPRTGCRSLPSFFCYDPSVYPLQGRQIMAKLLVRRNLFKGIPLKAAAYWYSVFKFPTFRRKAPGFKACNKHKGLCEIFLHTKVGILPDSYPSLWVSGYPSSCSAILRQKCAK